MIQKYSNLKQLKTKLQEKIARRLNFNSEYEADAELIGDFIDDAVSEIQVWRKLTKDDELLSGMYDSNIVNFVVESYNQMGAEGQSYDGNGSTTKQYLNTPLSRLKGSIPQRL